MAGVNLKSIYAETGAVNSAQNPAITPAAILSDIKLKQAELAAKNENKSFSAEELLLRKIESIPCLVDPFLQKVGLAAIVGSSDTGKSAFLRYLCLCIASGHSQFLGYNINAKYNRAIYVSTEDDTTAIAYLLNKQNKDIMLDPSAFAGLRFIFDTDSLLQTLEQMLTEQPVDIVCVDAFTDLFGRNLNQANEVRTFLNDYSQIAQKYQCLVLFLHHTGKRTDELLPNKHNVIGSQAFEAKMRLLIELRNDFFDKSLKHLCIVKGNYLPADFKNESYQLQFSENMTFINTGSRTPFESLAKASDDGRQKYELITQYRSQGFSLSEIAGMVGYSDKACVSNFIKRYEKKAGVVNAVVDIFDDNHKTTQPNQLPF